ncbi:hypothetical protein AVEN_47453-1 [Araneus ventricosus]|uniref:Uncharacterized protein n=1 Tax=Araneus ventricosus TaxID=182803 RepID=A0A4Y2IQN1_ARAVE|nr:hypothetical protein AVEN_47453-1 [Araneus ventricosus]
MGFKSGLRFGQDKTLTFSLLNHFWVDLDVWPRWPSGKVLALWPESFQVRNTIPLKIRRVWGLLHAKSYVVAKRPPVGVAWKFGEGVPAQVSSLSSDRGSKL